LQTYLSEALSLNYYPAEDPQAKCLLYWEPLTLPVLKDQKVGELHLVSADGKLLKQTILRAAEEVGLAWPYNWLAFLPSLPWLLFGGIGLVVLALLIIWRKM
jgi:D-alanyl-D-alanine carboxypeptidase (penicillin-binding protein 5/6)